ncbi:hypothetical protein BC936DRAFT_148074 [Jimgerdemannia flammicorona]|uniref:BRCT domain-containing protein n=1 Tax=Jimgerdemannia flammicorona TaxID=994334 RepID=A0A433D3T6_9FUNG|nr:hypothetical protein BC936DRAFT_148074 [Jimgerdemannia flammicorona]
MSNHVCIYPMWDHMVFMPSFILKRTPITGTLKTFAAALTHRWLIQDYKWIIDSVQAGQFLPESKYGVQFFETPFKGNGIPHLTIGIIAWL